MDPSGGRVWYLYQARRVGTNANAAGGAQRIDIVVPSGQVAVLLHGRAASSGAATNLVNILDEDNALHAIVVTSAATIINFPLIGTATGHKVMFGPGQKLAVEQQAAGAQNDTLTVSVTLLLSTSTMPTWDKSRSTNAADVTLAASTISTANTLQAVVL